MDKHTLVERYYTIVNANNDWMSVKWKLIYYINTFKLFNKNS